MYNREIDKRGLSIEMEFDKDIDLETCKESILHVMIELLNQQTKANVIEGVYAIGGNDVIKNYYDHLDLQTIEPRVVSMKKYVLAETILQVKTNVSAYTLY